MVPTRPRVLVVEDDAQLAHLYCTALAMNGYAVLRAADGLSALRSVEQYQPELVLLDLMMPNVDGWTVLRDFAAKPTTRDIPVIVVTGVQPTPTIPHARAVLSKPCEPDYMVSIVAQHLRVRGAHS